MNIKSMNVGDIFLSTNGNQLKIMEIGCEFDGVDNRWETFIKYELSVVHGSILQTIERACNVVIMLKQDQYYSQVSMSGNVTQSSVFKPFEIHFKAQHDFIANAVNWGLSPSDLNRTVMMGSGGLTKYQIVGADPKARLKKILVEGPGGGVVKVTVDQVKEGFKLYENRFETRYLKYTPV